MITAWNGLYKVYPYAPERTDRNLRLEIVLSSLLQSDKGLSHSPSPGLAEFTKPYILAPVIADIHHNICTHNLAGLPCTYVESAVGFSAAVVATINPTSENHTPMQHAPERRDGILDRPAHIACRI